MILNNSEFDYLAEGRKVVEAERSALEWLEKNLSQEFFELCNWLVAFDGSVVISGVGKAGLIGKKISATLASTGTPSCWMDPLNALHGDLGMVRSGDVAILLSNSGSSGEILEVAKSLTRLGVKVACFTKNNATPLARLSNLAISIGEHTEACPLRLAPSSSTTVMLCLGDALALTVQKAKGFSEKDYAAFHPAGALGRRLMSLCECMRPVKQIATATLDTPVLDVIHRISVARTGMCVLTDGDGGLVGVFSEGDFRRAWQEYSNIRELPVGNFCNRDCLYIKEDLLAGDALDLMSEHKVIALPVVDAGRCVTGLVLLRDIC